MVFDILKLCLKEEKCLQTKEKIAKFNGVLL